MLSRHSFHFLFLLLLHENDRHVHPSAKLMALKCIITYNLFYIFIIWALKLSSVSSELFTSFTADIATVPFLRGMAHKQSSFFSSLGSILNKLTSCFSCSFLIFGNMQGQNWHAVFGSISVLNSWCFQRNGD